MKKELLVCFRCKYKTPFSFAFDYHIKSKHAIASNYFLCSDKLKGHKSKRNAKFEFRCNKCSFETHSQFLSLLHGIGRQKWHECQQCGYKTQYAGNYKRHLDYIHGNLTHVCEYCGKKIRRKDDLKVHIAKHTGTSFVTLPFVKCEFCRYSGTCRNLRQHMNRIHNRKSRSGGVVMKQICKYCPFVGKSKYNLTRHVIGKHDDVFPVKWFQCEHCVYKTKFKGDFREHCVLKHTSGDAVTWFKCDFCHYKTKKQSHLNRHQRRKFSCKNNGDKYIRKTK